jgi:tetratricopeptide (TPR) repeat protein
MVDRVFLLVAVWLWGATAGLQAEQQATPADGAGQPEQQSAPETPLDSEVSAEEAIRLAIETFDRLEEGVAGDDRASLTERADRYIELVEAGDPGSPWLSYLYGRAFALLGRPGDAVEQLRKFVETREGRNEWRAYRLLGDLFVDQFPRLGKANYDRAEALNAGRPSVLFGLSRAAAKLGQVDEAVEFARRAAEADGRRDSRYVSNLASMLKAAGRWKEALGEAEAALRIARERMRRQPGGSGPLLAVDAQYGMLIEIMQARLSEPEGGEADDYLRLARYVRERGRVSQLLVLHDVLRTLEAGAEATAADPPTALLEQLGLVYAEVGRTGDAIAAFEQLLRADPGNPVANEWLVRLRGDPVETEQAQP